MNEIVERLKDLIEEHSWQDMFQEAIDNAQEYHVEGIGHIKTPQDYLKWIDGFLRWIPFEEKDGKEVYRHLCKFYFILDQEPVRSLQNKIEPHATAPPLTPLSEWMVAYANELGKFLDTTESLTEKSLESFYNSPPYNMDEYMPAPSGWKTFNQLFARHVKPGMRPIAALCDDRVIVSPADSTFAGWWEIRDNSEICVKGLRWTMKELLEKSNYRDRFLGGTFMHAFLGPNDYHRMHVPVGGTVMESYTILGQVYLDVIAVQKDGEDGVHRLEAVRTLEAEDGTGYQFAQARGLLVLEAPIGLVAVMPIGMAQVSSVVMTAEVGRKLHKGEEFAYFQFGGSDIIVLFEAACKVGLIAQPNVHYKQGTWIGQSHA